MASFPTLEYSAALYIEVMELWLKQRELMALSAKTLRYEDLIVNYREEMKQLLAFLDLEWDDSVMKFAKV